jgi:hypothetical protein
MRENIVYGVKDRTSDTGSFIEIHLYEDGLLRVYWASNKHAVSYFFTMKDIDEYDDFKDEMISVLSECDDINEAYYELENYLGSEAINEFLEEWHRY